MLTIRVEGYEIDLSLLEDVLTSTGVDRALLDQFTQDLLLSSNRQANPIWADAQFKANVIERISNSVPKKASTAELPTLPDQLSLLLRSELTLVSGTYTLDLEERDGSEQLLQDIIRPIIYHVIERHYADKPTAQPAALVASTISETIAVSWHSLNADKWDVRPLDSLIGHIGYEFRASDEVMYSNCPLTAEGDFFYSLAISLSEAICKIDLDKPSGKQS